MNLNNNQLEQLLLEIEEESLNIILDDGSITLQDYLFETKNFDLIINIDVYELTERCTGDYHNEPQCTINTKTDIEIVSISLEGVEYLTDNTRVSEGVKGVLMVE